MLKQAQQTSTSGRSLTGQGPPLLNVRVDQTHLWRSPPQLWRPRLLPAATGPVIDRWLSIFWEKHSNWNNLAFAYLHSGNRSAALQAVKELRRYDPQKADKVFNLIMKP
jgi:hypothetical protein